MKKLLLTTLLIFGFSSVCMAASINDVGGHSAATLKAVQEDIENAKEKLETVKNSQITLLILGGPSAWLSAGRNYLELGITKVTASVADSLFDDEEDGKGSAPKGALPEGEAMVKSRDKKLQASTDPEEANAKNKATTDANREIALTEMSTYGYSLGLKNRIVSSRATGDDVMSAQKTAEQKTTSATDYGAAVSASTSTANSTTQIFNNLLKTAAARNALRGLAVTEQNSTTNIMMNDTNMMSGQLSNLTSILQ